MDPASAIALDRRTLGHCIMHVPINDLALHSASIREDLQRAWDRVASRSHYILGPELEAFEAEFSAYCGTRHCVGVANGTDAIELALRGLGVGPGDDVLAVANAGGYSTTAILAAGARPIYMDVDDHTLTASARAAAALMTANVKAVVVTHLYGKLAATEEFIALASGRGVPVIEDCAQAHGAERNGRRAGSFGLAGTFSFYPTKNLGALGDAGAVVTNCADLAAAIRELRQYGWSTKYRSNRRGGRNSRLDELQAAILRELLPRLDGWNDRRREIMAGFNARFRSAPVICPPWPDSSHVAHLYTLRVQDRDGLRKHLGAEGIGADVHYPIPDYRQLAWRGPATSEPLPVTEQACDTLMTLPCFPEMTKSQQELVASSTLRWLESKHAMRESVASSSSDVAP